MVSQGDISFEDTIQALRTSTEEGGRFFNLMNRQSAETFKGISSNVADVSGQIKEKM